MVAVAQTEMARTMERQPADLRRILDDRAAVERAAQRLAARRVFLVGTGTSWHAANQGAWLMRLAGVDALAVQAADWALWGPRPSSDDALVLLSHRGTKRYTSDVLARARADGVPTVAIGGIGAPGVDVETVEQEKAGTFTASHVGALARLAQLAVALGPELRELDAAPDALASPRPGSAGRSRSSRSRSPCGGSRSTSRCSSGPTPTTSAAPSGARSSSDLEARSCDGATRDVEHVLAGGRGVRRPVARRRRAA